MSKTKKVIKIICALLVFVLIFATLYIFYTFYKTNYFNDFSRAEFNIYTSKFTRDKQNKYSDSYSYKIDSPEFNDAMFYKKVSVTPNTPYKVSCMVKTQNVENEKNPSNGGAQICIADTTERSKSITGTSDWQRLEFMFDSKNREEVEIAFRLGSFDDNSKGTVWFSDFKLEKGTSHDSSLWTIACFILENVNVNINEDGVQENVNLKLSYSEMDNIADNIERFKRSIRMLSGQRMSVVYDTFRINEELKTVSYDEENGYYVSNVDVQDIIEPYLATKNYDHIFVILKMGDTYRNLEIPVNDWIGLGGMDHRGIGFSNIRLPNNSNSNMYIYNPITNAFPEEVFVHEFLHTLERIAIEHGYDIPALHDSEKYGYENEYSVGLQKWYKAYMCKQIIGPNGEYLGLDEAVYKMKPINNNNFIYSMEVDFIREPQNIFEEIYFGVKSITRIIGTRIERAQNTTVLDNVINNVE